MDLNIRPGFEKERIDVLRDDPKDDGFILDATPAQRLAMMWRLAQDCWSFVDAVDVEREFQRHPEVLRRR